MTPYELGFTLDEGGFALCMSDDEAGMVWQDSSRTHYTLEGKYGEWRAVLKPADATGFTEDYEDDEFEGELEIRFYLSNDEEPFASFRLDDSGDLEWMFRETDLADGNMEAMLLMMCHAEAHKKLSKNSHPRSILRATINELQRLPGMQ